MKKKIATILLFFLLSFSHLQAQKVTWGTEIKEKNPYVIALLQTTKGVFCVYRQKTAGAFSSETLIEVHRYNLELVSEKQAEVRIEKKLKLDKVIVLLDEIYFIMIKSEKDNEKGYYALKFDQSALTVGEPILLDKLKDRKALFDNDYVSFDTKYSPDKTKVLIIGYPGQKKDEPQKVSLTVLDAQMKVLWKREEQLDYADKLFAPQDYELDNRGHVFLLAKIYKEKAREKIKGESNYYYLMLVYTNATDAAKEFNINLEGLLVAQLGFMLDNDNNPLCAGFYYDDNRRSGYIGMFYFKIDMQKNAIVNKNSKPFDEKLVVQLSGERAAKKNRGLDATFIIRKFLQRSDGGFVVLAEVSFIIRQTYTGARGTTSTTFIYNENQILAAQIAPEGKIGWIVGIDKQQVSTNDGGYRLSFGSGMVDDNVSLLFNVDAKKYAKKKLYYTMSNKSVLVSQKINKDGATSHSPLFNNNKDNIETIAMPRQTYQVSPNELLMFTMKRKKQRIVRIAF